MKHFCSAFILYLALLAFPTGLFGGDTMRTDGKVSHDLRVVLVPAEHRFSARDTITVPDSFQQEFHFLLHRGLELTSTTHGVTISRKRVPKAKIFKSFR
jgi:hypothetical protein